MLMYTRLGMMRIFCANCSYQSIFNECKIYPNAFSSPLPLAPSNLRRIARLTGDTIFRQQRGEVRIRSCREVVREVVVNVVGGNGRRRRGRVRDLAWRAGVSKTPGGGGVDAHLA